MVWAICMLRTIERPTRATLRLLAAAASITCCTRCTCDEKLATITRPVVREMMFSITGPMSFSSGVKPGTSALVESHINRSRPASPMRAKARRSVSLPSSGIWSILKSPVCRTEPPAVRITTASASGIEWFTATNSRSKPPMFSLSPSATTSWFDEMRCSLSFASTKARVSAEPSNLMSSRRFKR